MVATQAETAVIELDEPSCELPLQYRSCVCGGGGVGGGVRDSERLIKGTLIGTPNQQLMTVFYCRVKRQTIHQPANNEITKRRCAEKGGAGGTEAGARAGQICEKMREIYKEAG